LAQAEKIKEHNGGRLLQSLPKDIKHSNTRQQYHNINNEGASENHTRSVVEAAKAAVKPAGWYIIVVIAVVMLMRESFET